MAKRIKCDYCGKIYYKQTTATDEAGSLSGIGDIVGGVRDLSRIAGGGRNYCSTACKRAAKSEGGGASGGKRGIASALGLTAESQREEEQKQQQEQAAHTNSLRSVAEYQYTSTNPADISAIMQQLTVHFDQYKKKDQGFKDIGKSIRSKLEEGMHILDQNGTDPEDFYYKQAAETKRDFEKLYVRKLRANPTLYLGAATVLVLPWGFYSLFGHGGGFVVGLIIGVPLLVIGRLFVINKIFK